MARPTPKILRVAKSERLTKNMQRITLEGDELAADAAWAPGAYVKLILPDPETGVLDLTGASKPKVRTYTARYHDPREQTLAIDFALHQPAGPATHWALHAQAGDQVGLAGPGLLKTTTEKGDWHLFCADMAALPAASALLESLEPDAKGYALLEVTSPEDQLDLKAPAGIEIRWLIHPKPHHKSQQQLTAIKALTLPKGVANVFVAGELSTIREIKAYLLQAPAFQDAYLYVSSYWKIGLPEEGHKEAKRMATG